MPALADALVAPGACAAVLLVLAGAPKVAAPHDLRRALRGAGLRAPGAAVRGVGAAEVVLGVAALVVTSRLLLLLVALSYAAFTVFVVAALRSGWQLSSCGCFGKDDTPPSPLHAALTGATALVAGGAALAGTSALLPALSAASAGGVPLAALVALGTWLLYLALTALPQLGVRVAQVVDSRNGGAGAVPAAFHLLPVPAVPPRSRPS